jgi:membrane-bound ClpP family serine protease
MLGVVVGLLILGILLLLLEIIFVPGTTIVGVGGLIVLAIGIYLAYVSVSTMAGHISLASSVAVVFLALIVLLKGETWKRVALDNKLEGKGVESVEGLLKIGDKGKTISRLNPVGKAVFEERIVEVATSGDFVPENVEVEITKIEGNKIRVKTV